MLTYKLANVQQQYEEFLQLLQDDAADYLDRTMELMQMSWEQFTQIVQTVGRVYSIHQDDLAVGYYWIEERDRVLHLHGLFVKGPFQGKGIGTEVLNALAEKYGDTMEAIELGVHQSNTRARALYEKSGYVTVKCLDDLGFLIMQKPLSGKVD